jgi:hypothetical protein
MAIRDMKSTKNQLGLPPRPKLYDQCIIDSIGFEFLRGGYDGSFAQILFSALSGLFRTRYEKLERLGIDFSIYDVSWVDTLSFRVHVKSR